VKTSVRQSEWENWQKMDLVVSSRLSTGLNKNPNWQKDSKENFQHTTSFILQKKIRTKLYSKCKRKYYLNKCHRKLQFNKTVLSKTFSLSFILKNTIDIGRHFPSELCRKNIGLLADTFCFDDQFVYQLFFSKLI
jgi:hypothetical protein